MDRACSSHSRLHQVALSCAILACAATSDRLYAQFGYPATDMTRIRDTAVPTAPTTTGFGWGTPTFTTPTAPTTNVTATPDWQLGITVDNTTAGVVVRSVQPNSAAARAGLEPGDIILTVGGYQVGYVDNRLFDVGEEIRRRADATGRVRMLVQDLRSGKVNLLDVNLQNVSIAVQGDVVWRDQRALPAGATLQVKVDYVSRPYQAINGGILNAIIVQNQPIPFQLFLDQNYLIPNERYQIQASIKAGNQVLYATSQPILIDLSRGNVSGLRLELVPAGVVTAGSNYTTAYSTNSALANDYYQKYLNRPPTQAEMTAWLEYFNRGKPIEDLPVTLLGSAEFYERAGGTDALFIERMFRVVVQRPPSNEETSRWLQQLQRLGPQGRSQAVKDFWTAANRK